MNNNYLRYSSFFFFFFFNHHSFKWFCGLCISQIIVSYVFMNKKYVYLYTIYIKKVKNNYYPALVIVVVAQYIVLI